MEVNKNTFICKSKVTAIIHKKPLFFVLLLNDNIKYDKCVTLSCGKNNRIHSFD